MRILLKTLRLMSFAVGIVVALLAFLHFTQGTPDTMQTVAESIATTNSVLGGGQKVDVAEVASTVRVPAPQSLAELDRVAQGESAALELPAEVAEVAGPPEDASIGELGMYYFERLSAWLFGEREPSVEVGCKTRSGGKICSVSNG
ncbi:hypothetical protein [Celeribacter sp. SCSIO 80788]|uniref:hypothetical protein n=1 Tax=Celeribacter sp. SCSIO 80788 TaxID=3117013 RepID=UPI003DA3F236